MTNKQQNKHKYYKTKKQIQQNSQKQINKIKITKHKKQK